MFCHHSPRVVFLCHHAKHAKLHKLANHKLPVSRLLLCVSQTSSPHPCLPFISFCLSSNIIKVTLSHHHHLIGEKRSLQEVILYISYNSYFHISCPSEKNCWTLEGSKRFTLNYLLGGGFGSDSVIKTVKNFHLNKKAHTKARDLKVDGGIILSFFALLRESSLSTMNHREQYCFSFIKREALLIEIYFLSFALNWSRDEKHRSDNIAVVIESII
jgi:hypothetical protein